MRASGVVKNILPDDLIGSKHQRFTVLLKNGKTVLVLHNIDISGKILGLNKGDNISFQGEYQWNRHGGIVHWTHKDPHGKHENGWIKHKDKRYQ